MNDEEVDAQLLAIWSTAKMQCTSYFGIFLAQQAAHTEDLWQPQPDD